MIRAKLQLISVTSHNWNPNEKTLRFNAVCDDGTAENAQFARFTPTGMFEMRCNNPVVLEQLELDKYYYFDISPA